MKDSIKKFIEQTFLYGERSIQYDEPLFESGIVDSMGLIKLLAFVQREFKVQLNMNEISISNFDTIDKIAAVISAKQGA